MFYNKLAQTTLEMGCAATKNSADAVLMDKYRGLTNSYNSHNPKSSYFRRNKSKDVIVQIVRQRDPEKFKNANTVLVGYMKSNSIYSRNRKPADQEWEFIEHRDIKSNDEESRGTETTYLSVDENSRGPSPSSSTGYLPGQPRNSPKPPKPSKYLGAYNYEKRLEQLKLSQSEPTIALPKPVQQNGRLPRQVSEHNYPKLRREKTEEDASMDIVHHVSRREFIETTKDLPEPAVKNHVQQPPPKPPISIVHSSDQLITPRTMAYPTVSSSLDDLSENSFVVVQNTVKIAWEKDSVKQIAWERNGLRRDSDFGSGELLSDPRLALRRSSFSRSSSKSKLIQTQNKVKNDWISEADEIEYLGGDG